MRRLKVYYKHVTTPSRNPYSYHRGQTVPKIVLSGKWLESLGFKPGDFIKVHSVKDAIQIYKDE